MSQDRDWMANPAIQEYDGPLEASRFTVQGAAIKSAFLLAVLICTFAYTWNLTTQGYASAFSQLTAEGKAPDSIDIPSSVMGLTMLGVFGGFAVALVVIFAQRTAPYLSPVYAALEGLALGSISAAFEAHYPGIVIQTVSSTLGVTAGMLVLYSSGILRPTEKFMVGLLSAMVGILLLYFTDSILHLFGSYVPVVHSAGPWGILLQVAIVVVASLNLIVDFGLITDAAENKAPKWYEWYAGFSLLVTLVWLYLEILKLLAKLRSGD
jgi:uncharacterized YccA/Bax inhibitor family protein